jgi:hypothetical protein
MSADGIYDFASHVYLSSDSDTLDNNFLFNGENYETPNVGITMGDSICSGDTAYIYSVADGYTYWYDASSGGNLVGEGEDLMVSPTTTTSYYAEIAATQGYFQDFDSFNDGDFISVVDSNNWTPWPAAGATPGGYLDTYVSSAYASSGSNSLYLNVDSVHDPVLEFGQAFSSGKFYFSTDMLIITSAYWNMQESVAIGTGWSFDLNFDNAAGTVDVSIDQNSVLSGTYNGIDPNGSPIWINVELNADYSTGIWELSINNNSIGTFTNFDPVASANFYANTGNEYYIDNVEWSALKDDACRSSLRSEAIVNVEDCSININELGFNDLRIYPNPNNGLFTIDNSEMITDVFISNLQGKVVYSNMNVNSKKLNIDMNYLQRGMYMINIKTENDITSKTIIVQ